VSFIQHEGKEKHK